MPRKTRAANTILDQNVRDFTNGDHTKCWVWTGPHIKGPPKQPVVRIGKRTLSARRWVYEATIEGLPTAFFLRNICGRDICVNPWHTNSPFINTPNGEPSPVDEIRELIATLPPEDCNVEYVLGLDLGYDARLVQLAFN